MNVISICTDRCAARSRSNLLFFEQVAEVRDTSRQAKFFKILRIEMKNYSHHNGSRDVLNRTSMDINLFNTNLLDKIQISLYC
jgi:hypothetical protein